MTNTLRHLNIAKKAAVAFTSLVLCACVAPCAAWAAEAEVDPQTSAAPAGHWMVTDTITGSIERFWVEPSGDIAKNRLITADEAGYWAYATSTGAVVRGVYADPETGLVYLADNDGKLSDTGWVVTSKYGQGLQRYFVDAQTHACVPGYSADGYDHATTREGFVVRGAYADPKTGYVYLADNDGKLSETGWVVTSKYGQGLQRYFVDAQTHACVPGYSADGYDHATTREGFVVRGVYADPTTGNVYLADNDGKLSGTGWLVTDAYGQGLQRYFVDETAHACVPGYSTDGYPHYTTEAGYVLRGELTVRGVHLFADNDGRLSISRWVCTDAVTGSLERFWVEESGEVATNRLITPDEAGYWAYATSTGAVVRGVYADPETGLVYLADNDGKLSDTGWVVTSKYGQGLQRYFVDAKTHACIPGFSTEGYAHVTSTEGYVVRGAATVNGEKYLADNDGKVLTDTWAVTGAFTNGDLQRYWASSEGAFAVNTLLSEYVAGYWAYATSTGAVARGRYTDPQTGYVYLANNEGELENPGWLVTSAYGQGLQRYCVDADYHACIPGFSEFDYLHYTTKDGYVARGDYLTDMGIIFADNDGRVDESAMQEGWAVTDAFDGRVERYYFQSYDGHLYATVGFFQAQLNDTELWFYGIPEEGYVVRSKYTTNNGVLVANGDGVLIENSFGAGFAVTDAFDGEYQRYFLQNVDGHLYAKTGYFEVTEGGETKAYFGDEEEGYVVRNDTRYYDGVVYKADNDGVLTAIAIDYNANETRDPTLSEVTWSTHANYLNQMRLYASIYESATDWFIAADWTLCRVTILQRVNGNWVVSKTWNGNFGYSGVGNGDTHTIKHKQICNWDDSYFGLGYNDWSSCYIESYSDYNVGGHSRYIPGYGYEDCASIHSTGYNHTGYDNRGCIGLTWDNAKFVYDYIPVGTNMYLF
ncbi:MAG: L,D-transpeptidase [Coriobacteriia bacterium]|nr:L,D-transpeptidase [Coriobacteriia bacterium]